MVTKSRSTEAVRHGASEPVRKDGRERRLFEALRTAGGDAVEWAALPRALRQAGLRLDDPRLSDSLKVLEAVHPPEAVERKPLTYDEFVEVVKPNILVIERALQQSLVIPNFDAFTREIDDMVKHRNRTRGAGRRLHPQLGRVDHEQFGVSLCTIGRERTRSETRAPCSHAGLCKR